MKQVVLYENTIGDVSDPDTYASGMVMLWEGSDRGKWAKEHCNKGKIWYINDIPPLDTVSEWAQRHGHYHAVTMLVQVFGEMLDEDYTYYMLKWGNKD